MFVLFTTDLKYARSWWANNLGVLLIGRAQAAYRVMARSEATDYNKVKKEILCCLNINPENYQQTFHMKKKKEEKSLRILLQQLPDLLEKWLKPQKVSKVELCNQILLEQFLTDLKENTQPWVRCHRLKSSTEALCLAEDFDSAQTDNYREKAPRSSTPQVGRENEQKET
uniref:SCAN box domain-containing protein n=1 Tax=Crocodylus porosus TaxID=8502 RepID=A0A7M4EAY2_CROPO